MPTYYTTMSILDDPALQFLQRTNFKQLKLNVNHGKVELDTTDLMFNQKLDGKIMALYWKLNSTSKPKTIRIENDQHVIERDFNYYTYVQSYQFLTLNFADDNISMYSFDVRPEETDKLGGRTVRKLKFDFC